MDGEQALETLIRNSLEGTFELFASNELLYGAGINANGAGAGAGPATQAALAASGPSSSDQLFELAGTARKLKLVSKMVGEYGHVQSLSGAGAQVMGAPTQATTAAPRKRARGDGSAAEPAVPGSAPAAAAAAAAAGNDNDSDIGASAQVHHGDAAAGDTAELLAQVSDEAAEKARAKRAKQLQATAAAKQAGATAGPHSAENSQALVVAAAASAGDSAAGAAAAGSANHEARTRALALFNKVEQEKPTWHAPWKLYRVIAGHNGWVRSIAIDPSNEWFATGSNDRTIKIWDLASGTLKLTLTGHINVIRGLAVSDRHPYLFSAGDDKTVKCWDLEQNKVVRNYSGHTSGVYCMAIHPTLNLIVTGSRDSTARVWDIRTKTAVYLLGGHKNTVFSVAAQGSEPQVITGSADSVIRTWDLRTGKTATQLTHHKKSVRALALHPTEYTFASGAADNLKKWKCPEARFMMNFSGHNAIVNALSVNEDNVLVSSGDNGTMRFWDWRTGYPFQTEQTRVQPGSLDAECGIYASAFDMTGSRLFTCEADKSIKVWREDESATPESHPIAKNWRPLTRQNAKY